MILAFLNINISNAQTFVAATTPDSQAANNQINVTNTGNYSVEYESDNLHVMVWDGDSPGLAWYNSNGDQGNMAFDGNNLGQIQDPDVALYVDENSNNDKIVYTFIIYLINGNVFYESWIYNQGIWTINENATQVTFSGQSSTPNTDTDTDPNKYLAAVWQDGFDIILFKSNPETPLNYTLTTLYTGAPADTFQTPDVAVMDNVLNIVHIFNSHVGVYLRIDHLDWLSLNLNSQDDFYLLSSGLASQLGRPRIATPNHAITNGLTTYLDNYQAVIKRISVDGNEILGFNKYQTTVTGPTQLNAKLTSYGNFEPVVTYTANNNLIASWLYNHVLLPSGGSGVIVPTNGNEMLQTKLNINGGNPINPANYFVVNYQFPRQCLAPSVSGRFAKWDRVLYTSYDNQNPNEIFYKTSPYGGSNIRIGRVTDKPLIYPNPANDKVYINLPNFENTCNIEVFDVNGRLVLSKSINSESSILDISNLHKGIYYIRFLGISTLKIEKLIIN